MALEPYILPQDQLRMDRPQVPAGIVNALLAETSKDMAHSLVLDGYDMQVTLQVIALTTHETCTINLVICTGVTWSPRFGGRISPDNICTCWRIPIY